MVRVLVSSRVYSQSASKRFTNGRRGQPRSYCFVSLYSTVVQQNYTVIMNTFQNGINPSIDFRLSLESGVRSSPKSSGEERGLPSLTAACINPGKGMKVFCFFFLSVRFKPQPLCINLVKNAHLSFQWASLLSISCISLLCLAVSLSCSLSNSSYSL